MIYASVGRRLGYPISLVGTKTHLFCRWDGDEVFNIEASGHGVSFPPDDEYRTGKYEMSPGAIRACGYLESLSPREELAGFLLQRGECWMQERNYDQATTAYVWAHELDPRRGQHKFATVQCVDVWEKTLKARLPSRLFPKFDIGFPAPQFRNMPNDFERKIIYLKILQGLLNDRDYDRRWWQPLRQNPGIRPAGLPKSISVDFRWNDREVPVKLRA